MPSLLDGWDTQLWVDRWLLTLLLGHPTPQCSRRITLHTHVALLIYQTTRIWDIECLRPFVIAAELNTIYDIAQGDQSGRDRLIWTADRRGKFSIRSGYH